MIATATVSHGRRAHLRGMTLPLPCRRRRSFPAPSLRAPTPFRGPLHDGTTARHRSTSGPAVHPCLHPLHNVHHGAMRHRCQIHNHAVHITYTAKRYMSDTQPSGTCQIHSQTVHVRDTAKRHMSETQPSGTYHTHSQAVQVRFTAKRHLNGGVSGVPASSGGGDRPDSRWNAAAEPAKLSPAFVRYSSIASCLWTEGVNGVFKAGTPVHQSYGQSRHQQLRAGAAPTALLRRGAPPATDTTLLPPQRTHGKEGQCTTQRQEPSQRLRRSLQDGTNGGVEHVPATPLPRCQRGPSQRRRPRQPPRSTISPLPAQHRRHVQLLALPLRKLRSTTNRNPNQ